MNRIFYDANGKNFVFSENEIIKNALQQEADGIKPGYCWYDYQKKERVTPPGWLVVSTFSGCCIVYRRNDGKMIILTGRQGDFCYC